VDILGLDWTCCKHWAIIFKFDNRTIRYEIIAIPDEKGVMRITPQWLDDKNSEGGCNRTIYLGNVETSPLKIHDIGRKNKYNYTKYELISKNCQEWAKEMLQKIDVKLSEALDKNDIRSIKEQVSSTIQSSSSSMPSS
jgi:hypothetical protein